MAGISIGIGLALSQTINIDGWSKLLLTGGPAFVLAAIIGFFLLGKDKGYLWSFFTVSKQE